MVRSQFRTLVLTAFERLIGEGWNANYDRGLVYRSNNLNDRAFIDFELSTFSDSSRLRFYIWTGLVLWPLALLKAHVRRSSLEPDSDADLAWTTIYKDRIRPPDEWSDGDRYTWSCPRSGRTLTGFDLADFVLREGVQLLESMLDRDNLIERLSIDRREENVTHTLLMSGADSLGEMLARSDFGSQASFSRAAARWRTFHDRDDNFEWIVEHRQDFDANALP